jgi:ubiquitin-like-conjugating enzyme ATG3
MQNAREWATPTLKESAFLERGVLTPEEFVKAGDELVYKCPTWSWESGDSKKIKNYLPADKQVRVMTEHGFYTHVTCVSFTNSLT